MSSKRVSSLSSAYDAPAPDAAPSAVASLASRFDAAPDTTKRPAVADKLSGIASAFGTTVDQDRAPGRSNGGRNLPQRGGAAKKPDEPPPEPTIIAASNPKVGDTAARFDGRFTPEQAAPNAFASAHERFLQFEADNRSTADTRVSGMAKMINDATKEQTKAAVTPPAGKDVVIAPPPPSGRGVGGLASRFERVADDAAVAAPSAASVAASKAAAAKDAVEREAQKVDQSAHGNDFASAAQRFAEAEKRTAAPAAADPDQAPEDSAQSRFADAARLFGGS